MNKPLRLGIAGLGTVGVGVLDVIANSGQVLADRTGREIVVTGVSARSRNKQRGGHDLSGYRWFETPHDLATSDKIDVFVELIGGEDGPVLESVEAALISGKHVVTANKAMLAHHGARLARLADDNSVSLNFEAAIAGGIPVVKVMRESLAGNGVKRVYGILNGTCNYILTKMDKEGLEFADVLKEAQALGYAEADPSFDIGGIDAAHKITCLASIAFGVGTCFENVYIEGIEQVTLADIRNAADLGYKIKLLAVALETGDGIEQRVHPSLVPAGTPIAEVDGVFNAVGMTGDFVDDLLLQGRGAGAHPTASSVISDIADIARGIKVPAFGVPSDELRPCVRARMRAHEGGYYVAMDLYDKPGSVAFVASAFSDHGISIESIVQRATGSDGGGGSDRPVAPFILITHDTLESSMRAVLGQIGDSDFCSGQPRMIRIERY